MASYNYTPDYDYTLKLVQFGQTPLFPIERQFDFSNWRVMLDDGTKIVLNVFRAREDLRTELRPGETAIYWYTNERLANDLIIDDYDVEYIVLTDNKQASGGNTIYYDAANPQSTMKAIAQRILPILLDKEKTSNTTIAI